jgi:hypothetical protein
MISDFAEENSFGEGIEIELEKMAAELSQSIENAKTLAKSCKISNYEDAEYKVDESGVIFGLVRNS